MRVMYRIIFTIMCRLTLAFGEMLCDLHATVMGSLTMIMQAFCYFEYGTPELTTAIPRGDALPWHQQLQGYLHRMRSHDQAT